MSVEFWPNLYVRTLGTGCATKMGECPGCGFLLTFLELAPGLWCGQCGDCRADITTDEAPAHELEIAWLTDADYAR